MPTADDRTSVSSLKKKNEPSREGETSSIPKKVNEGVVVEGMMMEEGGKKQEEKRGEKKEEEEEEGESVCLCL